MDSKVSADERQPLLMVCHFSPWGENAGVRMRLRLALEALGSLGPVDVVVLSPERIVTRPPDGVRRLLHLKDFSLSRSIFSRAHWLLAGSVPRELVGCDYTEVRRQLTEWLAPRYAMAWVARARTLHAVAPTLRGIPVVLDLDDLEAEKISAQLATERRALLGSPRRLLRRARARRNLVAWRRFEKEQACLADASVVCSDQDASILGAANVNVVPNGYQVPSNPVGRVSVGSPPSILIQGFMVYLPNLDALKYFVEQILPRVRASIPDVRLRVVGKASEKVWKFHSPPHVTVTGFVPKIEDELAAADVVAVPLRFGGGTRIKILEALAHRIPVVSTSIGAHGLSIENRTHALIADDPEGFAEACVRLLTDEGQRRHLASTGAEHVNARFTHDAVIDHIHRIAHELMPEAGHHGQAAGVGSRLPHEPGSTEVVR